MMDYELKKEIEKHLIKSTQLSYDGTITEFNDCYRNIISIEKLVLLILQSEGDIFFVSDNKMGSTGIKKSVCCTDKFIYSEIQDYVRKEIIRQITFELPIHSFNPYIDLFIKNWIKIFPYFYFDNSDDELAEKAKALNEFIDSIRTGAESQEFNKTINNYERVLKQNYKSLVGYIDRLFNKHGRLLVMRVDFCYTDNPHPLRTEAQIHQAYLQAKKDREHFFSNTRTNKLFDNMLGYVWKLEYGLKAGFHYHMLFFFNGSKVRQDVDIAKMLGEYWVNTITAGRGRYFNCNAQKSGYEYLGIGMIRHKDDELMKNLKKAAEYLTKADYFAKVAVKGKGRTFGKGELAPNSDKRGRPRSSDKIQSPVMQGDGIQSHL